MLPLRLPANARIESMVSLAIPCRSGSAFDIENSQLAGSGVTTARTGPCADCLRELHDPADRRYGYPFLNCTACGPRYTIVRSFPYDLSRTTIANFPYARTAGANTKILATAAFTPSRWPIPAAVPSSPWTVNGLP